MAELITREFIPVRASAKEQPQTWARFKPRWTPTILFLDPNAREHFRIEGSLPADEYLGQLELGLGYLAVGQKDWADAEQHFNRAADEHAETAAGPEGLYWRGVARYSASRDKKHLQDTARELETRYAGSAWAKRAEVWKPKEKETGKAAA